MKRVFTRSSNSVTYLSRRELESVFNDFLSLNRLKFVSGYLLDSSLITPTFFKYYHVKLINCGEYNYVYQFDNMKKKKEKDLVKMKDKKYILNRILIEEKKIENRNINENIMLKNKIDIKNINRSKYNLQMLIKTNEKEFKTFITLTFKDEIINIKEANKKFDTFKTKIKRVYNNFSYVCVPEFQKSGKVHYHLLTNISYDDINLIVENRQYLKFLKSITSIKPLLLKKLYSSDKFDLKLNDINVNLRYYDNVIHNTKKTYNFKSKNYKVFKTLRFWNYGFSNVVSIEGMNIIGYLTKYLSKDIDNRLFGFRRYFYSTNLIKPSINYINFNDSNDLLYYLKNCVNSEVVYEYSYKDYFGSDIKFLEYKFKNL